MTPNITPDKDNSLGVPSGGASCDYVNTRIWNEGFIANIVLTNSGAAPIDGWSAQISGSDPYTATNMD